MVPTPDNHSYEWRKSSRSANDGECVEVAFCPEAVKMRDSKDPDGPVLSFTVDTWRDFIDSVRLGKFDLVEHVEVVVGSDLVVIRYAGPRGPRLQVSADVWQRFVQDIQAGKFDMR